jgi:hypothetical protein
MVSSGSVTGRARAVAGGAWAGYRPSSGGNKRWRGDGCKACEEAERVGSVDFFGTGLFRIFEERIRSYVLQSNVHKVEWSRSVPPNAT